MGVKDIIKEAIQPGGGAGIEPGSTTLDRTSIGGSSGIEPGSFIGGGVKLDPVGPLLKL